MKSAVIKSLLTLLLLAFSSFLNAGSLGEKLDSIFTDDAVEDEILDPEIAFLFNSRVVDAEHLSLGWTVESGYYLYQNRFSFKSLTPSISVGEITFPAGKAKNDPAFGDVIVYPDDVELNVPIVRSTSEPVNLELEIKYQGCKEDSICYPPITKLVSFDLPAATASKPGSTEVTATVNISEQDAISRQLSEKSLWVNLAIFFVFGLLLALTPCVFPMIPILSGIIVGQGENMSTRKAFILSLAYVLAMALTYAVLGMIAGSFKLNLQAASQNLWVILAFSFIFIVLALSMFGFYEITMPAAIQSRLGKLSDKQGSGSVQGAMVMGVLSAIIVGPCVAPPLAGALLFISQSGDALLGGAALFAMGLGFGVPLLVIGTSAGKLLPEAGVWMNSIKAVFGVIMLGVAIWFLERILPGLLSMLLWAILLIVSAIFMGALDHLEYDSVWSARLKKGLGLVLLLYGCLVLIGAVLGNRDVLNPLANVSFTEDVMAKQKLDFSLVKSESELDALLHKANENQQAVMLDFYADWCVACKEMEKYTFSEPAVQAALDSALLIKADVTANDEIDQALLDRFNLFGPPATLFFVNGEERQPYRLVGFVKPDRFLPHVKQALKP